MFSLPDIFLNPGTPIGGSTALGVAALGGLVWVGGWIAEGFTLPDPEVDGTRTRESRSKSAFYASYSRRISVLITEMVVTPPKIKRP
jgi:hypothetical protein